jgi:phage terminase large subunit-like protein
MKILQIISIDFRAFVHKAYYEMHGEHIEGDYVDILLDELQPFADGEHGKLIVNLPPRHLKTFIFGVCFVSWVMAHRPKTRVLVLAGTDKLANDILRMLQQIMSSTWYKKAFGPVLETSDKTLLTMKSGGVVRSSSIRANFTGFGGELIVVDDPADVTLAPFPEELEAINDVFDRKVMSRRNNPSKASVIVIQHRLAANDLSGHLLAQRSGWRHLCLPLIAERDEVWEPSGVIRKAGELLRPGSYMPEELKMMKEQSALPSFDTYYQQKVLDDAFLGLEADCFDTFAGEPAGNLPLVISVDPAYSQAPDSCFSVLQVWVPWNNKHLLVDQKRGRFSPEQLRMELFKLAKRYLPSLILIENNGPGPALATAIESKTSFKTELVHVPPKNKRERFLEHVEVMRARQILISKKFSDRDIYVDEMINFSHSRFKDQGDATVQYLDRVLSGRPLPNRPHRAIHSHETESSPTYSVRHNGIEISVGNIGVLLRKFG